MSYPTSIPVFTDLTDDVDYILAADQNDPNDVITAIATMIGAAGAAQSYSTDILEYLSNKQAPILTKASGSTLSLSAGAIVIKNSAQSKRYLKRNTAAVTITASNIDTGSLALNTMYYVYAIGDAAATTFTVVFSTSATNPNVAAGVIYELVGWFYNQSAGALDVTLPFVGNVKKNGRDVPNSVHTVSTASDTVNDTSYGSDMTGTVVQFYSNGRPILVVFKCNNNSSADKSLILDVDGSDQSDSEVQNSGSLALFTQQLNYLLTSVAAGAHTLTIQAKVSSGSATVTAKSLEVMEL